MLMCADMLRTADHHTDNHVWSTGSITDAVKAARSVAGFSMKIEVETRSLEEAREAVGIAM